MVLDRRGTRHAPDGAGLAVDRRQRGPCAALKGRRNFRPVSS
jgi:hypothetical protein